MNDPTITIPCHIRTVRGINEPIVFSQDGKVFTSSDDVAAYCSKQHFHVLRSIKALIADDNSCASNFGFTSRNVAMPSGGTRQISTCNMTRDGFTLLAMGFTGKRALAWKLKYIEAFNVMEAKLAKEKSPAKPRLVHDYETLRTPTIRKTARLHAVDKMDAGLDLLITVETALRSEHWLDTETVRAISGAISQAIKILSPVREQANNQA